MKIRSASVAVAAVTMAATTLLASPAYANHVVTWGAGADCATAGKTATTGVNQPVRFAICVTLGGEPLPGHQMQARVVGPTRTTSAQVTTDDAGRASFAVQPTAAGATTVTLCDADGCVYGSTVITVTPAAAPTTPPATTAPAPTPTVASAVPPVAAADEGGLDPLVWILVALLLLLLGGGLFWFIRKRDNDDPRDEPPPVIYGEEISQVRLHDDKLQVRYWKTQLTSESATAWVRPRQGGDAYILNRTDRPLLWIFLEILDKNSQRVGLRMFRFNPDGMQETAPDGRQVPAETVSWSHNARQQDNWPGYREVLTDPTRRGIDPPAQQPPPLAHVSHPHDFDVISQHQSEELVGGQRPDEAYTYRLLDCVVQFAPIDDDAGTTISAFEQGLGGVIETMVDSAVADLGTAIAGATGPFERVTQAVLDQITERWKEADGSKAPMLFVRLQPRGRPGPAEIPIDSAAFSAKDAPVNTPPELWVMGSATEQLLEVSSDDGRYPDLDLTTILNAEVRLVVRRQIGGDDGTL